MTAGRESLLGTYLVTALHMVGAPLPSAPRSPSQWQAPLLLRQALLLLRQVPPVPTRPSSGRTNSCAA